MSYFCAKAITIDKQAKTYKVRGGDNNVVPRMDYWSNEHSLRLLLPDLASGCTQFTTRTDKHVAINALVKKYNAMLETATGYGAYELWSIIRGDLDPNKMEESKAYYGKNFSSDYARQQVKMIEDKVALWNNPEKMQEINAIVNGFVTEVTHLKIEKPSFVVRRKWDGVFVKRQNRYSLSLTRSIEHAKKFTQAAAESALYGFEAEKYEIIKAGE